MALDVTGALRDGLYRTVERNGLALIGAFVVLRIASVTVSQTITRTNRELLSGIEGAAGPGADVLRAAGPTPLALPIPLPSALVLALAVAVSAESVRIIAVRTFVSERTRTIPEEFVTRNITAATVNGFVGGIVVLALVTVGLVLLVVPGVFLALAFFFVRQEIAIEDENFIDAMAGSWSLTAGDRPAVLGLALVVFAVGFLAAIPGGILRPVDPALSAVVTAAVSAVTTVYGIAVAARAYDQLRAERAERLGLDDEGEFAL